MVSNETHTARTTRTSCEGCTCSRALPAARRTVTDPGDGKGPLPPAADDAEPPKPSLMPESPQTPAGARSSSAATITTTHTPVDSSGGGGGGGTEGFAPPQLAPDPFTHLAGAIASPRRPVAGSSAAAAAAGPADPISLAEEIVTATATAAAAATDSYMAPYYAEAERRALEVVEAYADPYVETVTSKAETIAKAATPYLETVAQARGETDCFWCVCHCLCL